MAIAFNLYNLLSPTLTFAILVALTAVMTGFALRYDRKGIAVTAIIGGFTAPFIARSSNYDFTATLIYMAILDSAVLAIANRKNWWTLTPLSCWLTYITCGIGVLASSADTGIWLAAIFYYFAIFAVSTVIGIERNREMQNATLSLVSALRTQRYRIHSLKLVSGRFYRRHEAYQGAAGISGSRGDAASLCEKVQDEARRLHGQSADCGYSRAWFSARCWCSSHRSTSA